MKLIVNYVVRVLIWFLVKKYNKWKYGNILGFGERNFWFVFK